MTKIKAQQRRQKESNKIAFLEQYPGAGIIKNITIVNDASGVVRMMIVSDAATLSDTYGCQLRS